jgi:hypothetical protein
MRLNPETLLEETEEELQVRQKWTGVLGAGHSVECHPSLEDPTIHLQQHRAVCMTRPHAACCTCPHSVFTVLFKNQPGERYSSVACPRWTKTQARADGEDPAEYVMTEVATCESRPFDFCSSCPTKNDLVQIYSADKAKPGWYSRWHRLRQKEFESDE